MNLFRTLALAAVAASIALPAAASAQRFDGPRGWSPNRQIAFLERPRDQDRAFRATVEGRSMPLPQLERRVVPSMRGADYLGPEFHGDTYRLKFMRAGRVIWVDVDAATGQVVGKSGE